MPSLKDLRNRISSVKSTQKITSAMKMVAAAKLRKAQENALQARPYSEKLYNIVKTLVLSEGQNFNRPSLVLGTEKNTTQLIVVCSADRGLCGGFNGSVVSCMHALGVLVLSIKVVRTFGSFGFASQGVPLICDNVS